MGNSLELLSVDNSLEVYGSDGITAMRSTPNRQTIGQYLNSDKNTISKPITQQEAAETFGVDSSMLRAFRSVEAELPEEAERVRQGETSVSTAYNKVKKKKKKAKAATEKVVPITQDVVIEAPKSSVEWGDVADLAGLTIDTIDVALEDHTHPLFMVATRLKANREQLSAELSPLGKPERRRVMKAVLSVLAHEQDVFESAAKAAITKYNRDLEVKLKAELKKQKALTRDMGKLLKSRFDSKDFKYIRGVLHTDRDVDPERRAKAFDLFLKLKPLFN